MTDSPLSPAPKAVPSRTGSQPDRPLPGPAATAGTLQPPSAVFGRPAIYHAQDQVPVTLGPADLPRLASLIANLDTSAGTPRELGGGLLWERNSGYTALTLTVTPEGETTVVRGDINAGGRQFAYYGAALGAAGLSALIATKFLAGLPATGVGLATLIPYTLAARTLWNASARRSALALRRLVDQVAAALRGEWR